MTTLNLPEQLLIRHTAELKEAWLATLQSESGDVVLAAGAVERTDATGLTLLLSLVRQLEADGRAWQWSSPSTALMDAAQALGVAHHLHLQTH